MLRKLAKAMIKRCDAEKVKKDGELLPGGDIRCHGNQWIRASYESSGIQRCPVKMQPVFVSKKWLTENIYVSDLARWSCANAFVLCHAVCLFVCACALSCLLFFFIFGLWLKICLQRFWEDWWRTQWLDCRSGPLVMIYIWYWLCCYHVISNNAKC